MKTELEKNLEEWLENPFWRGYYEQAPSEKCREFIALEFCYSEYEEEETAEAMDRIEENLGIEDLRHLLKYVGHNPRKGYLAKRIAELEELDRNRNSSHT